MSPANATAIEVEGGGQGDKFEVGKTYEVKQTTGIQYKGIVLAYDSEPHFVIFQEGTMPEAGESMTTRMVNANFISKLKYMGKFKDPLASKKGLVDPSGLQAKEALSIRLRVQWENKDILIMEDVRILTLTILIVSLEELLLPRTE